MREPAVESLAKAFVDQAVEHLQDDFMPKIERCLEQLTEEEFWQRGSDAENSVGNLILHLCGNVRQWIVSGLGGATDCRERPKEFAARGGATGPEAMARLRETVREAISVLQALSPADLMAERPIQVYRKTGLQAVFHAVEHFSYHTGQIVFATKIFKRKDMRFYDL